MFGRRRPPDDLERILRRYLELQVGELEARAAAAEAARQADAARAEVSRMVLFLTLLAVYSVALGVASQELLLSALVDPQPFVRFARDVGAGGSAAIEAVPGALQGVLISAVTAFGLLVFRATSTSIRSDVGGLLFVGIAVLCLAGIAAAAVTGTFGLLVGLPGFVAATLVVGQLCLLLARLHDRSGAAGPAAAGLPARRSSKQLATLSRRVSPAGRPWVAVAFAALPVLCVLAVAGSYVTHGGPLYGPAFAARFVAAAWGLWAVTVTPAAARIPLWSTIGWGGLGGVQLSDSPVAAVFLVAVAGLLYANVLWLALARREPTAADQAFGR